MQDVYGCLHFCSLCYAGCAEALALLKLKLWWLLCVDEVSGST